MYEERNDITQIWQDYQRGKDYLDSINLFERVEKSFNFTEGDQWAGLKYGNERPPQLNILEPMLKSSIGLVGQNNLTMNYVSMNYGAERAKLLKVCEELNSYARQQWEHLKMDTECWDILKEAYIAGDGFMYFYDDSDVKDKSAIRCEKIDTTNIMLGDEQQPDIQKQPYILIVQRKNIKDVKRMAKRNGVSDDAIRQIQPDTDTALQINGTLEVKNDSKLIVVAKLWKKDGFVHIARATKTVVIQPDTTISGMKKYPIAKYSWNLKKGTARGIGEIWTEIPNQISVNKALYRLEQAVKSSAYPIKAYKANALDRRQVDKLNQPGANIAVSGSLDSPVSSLIQFVQPASISPYAVSYWQDLMRLTRELKGAGDNLENVNPEQASGSAIMAALEAKQVTVNHQVAAYKQFVEDIAAIWFDMFVTYNPNGLIITHEEPDETGAYTTVIPAAELLQLDVYIKIDATTVSGTLSAVKDAQLKDLLEKGAITFEEYVDALPEDTLMPKEELKKIVAERKAAQMPQMPGTENFDMAQMAIPAEQGELANVM